jgi:hypothetical protein
MNGSMLRERRSAIGSLAKKRPPGVFFNVPGPPEKPPRALGGVARGSAARAPRYPLKRNGPRAAPAMRGAAPGVRPKKHQKKSVITAL